MMKQVCWIFIVVVICATVYWGINRPNSVVPEQEAQHRDQSVITESEASLTALTNPSESDVMHRLVPESEDLQIESEQVQDPELLAILDELVISADDDRIEYVYSDDGQILKEIDNDSSSHSYQKPLQHYQYSGDNIVSKTTFRYVGDRIEIERLEVAYDEKGVIRDYRRVMQ